MSINNFTDVNSFSISGLQNIFADTINGNQILSTINIAGQVFYLSWDSTTNTLTLLIPNATSLITGLLTSTDWNTFNGKENTLTFTSPLRRIGNTIDFDFSTANFWTGVNHFNNAVFMTGYLNHTGDGVKLSIGNFVGADFSITDNITGNDIVKVENDGTKIDILNYLRTGGKFRIINALTGIDFMELDFDLARTLFNTDMLFRGASTTCENTFIVENLLQLQYAFRAYINKTVHPTLEFFYVEVNGDVGFFGQLNPLYPLPAGGPVWKIESTGNANFVSANLQNTLVVENLQGAVDVMKVYRDGNLFPVEYLYFNNSGSLGFNPGAWSINRFGQFNGSSVIVNDNIVATNSIQSTGGILGGLGLDITGNQIYFQNPIVNTNNYYTVNFDTGTKQLSVAPSVLGTANTFVGDNTFIDDLTSTRRFLATNTTFRNSMRFTHFEQTPAISAWISAEFSYDAIDKVVIGNLGLAVPGRRACIGAHDTTLGAWRELDLNPGSLTVSGSLTVIGVFTNLSDKRIKTDIQYLDANKSFNFIKRLKPCIYRRCEDINDPYMKNEDQPKRKLQLGFIADEILDIAETEAQKSLITTFKYAGYDDCKQLAMIQLIPEIVQANKEMIDKIEKLETENKLLQERINAIQPTDMSALEERLLKLENIIKNKKCIAFI